MSAQDKRLAGADFLRAFACLTVLIHHLAQHFPHDRLGPAYAWLVPFENMGGYGVAIFFVLSGFLLSRPFWKALDAEQPMPSLRVYLLRRVARVGPGFWLVLTLGFLAGIAFFNAPPHAGTIARYVSGLLFIADWHWYTMFPIELNGPLWSIGFEVSSYLIMPIGFLLLFSPPIRRRAPLQKRLVWIGVVFLTLALHAVYVQAVGLGRSIAMDEFFATPLWHTLLGELWYPQYNPIGFFAIFAIGCLSGGVQVLLARHKSVWFDIGFVVALLWVVFRLWTSTGTTFDGILHLPYKMYPELPLAVGAVLALGPSTVLAARFLEPAIVRYIAQISFGIYIWHFFFIDLTRRFIYPEFIRYPESARIDDPMVLLSASAIVIVATGVTAAASWRWLEQPALRWAHRLESRQRIGRAEAAVAG